MLTFSKFGISASSVAFFEPVGCNIAANLHLETAFSFGGPMCLVYNRERQILVASFVNKAVEADKDCSAGIGGREERQGVCI